MSLYIIFFGKSQDFTTKYYDRNACIQDFNDVIKDFDLLESKVFTIDDIKNKEILSRYLFSAQGKKYCLLKLYSFAQAFSGNRIAGSIYGVGLLSENNINLTKDNLALLRAAKDNFAKLSLEGLKFNKSDFSTDSDRIWSAIVNNNNINLLDKVSTSDIKLSGSSGQTAIYVKDLFSDAIKLNDRILGKDVIYFSEDLEHLKRTQGKWGKDVFPLYMEQNNQLIPYKEQETKTASPIINPNPGPNLPPFRDEITTIKQELADCQYNHRVLKQNHEKLFLKQKLYVKLIFCACFLILLLSFFLGFGVFDSTNNPDGKPKDTVLIAGPSPLDKFIEVDSATDHGISFLLAVKFIKSYTVKTSVKDSLAFINKFKFADSISKKYNIEIKNLRTVFQHKYDSLHNLNKNEKNILDSNNKTNLRKPVKNQP